MNPLLNICGYATLDLVVSLTRTLSLGVGTLYFSRHRG
jgi:hypothetical protein